MTTLIIFASKYGQTRKVAARVASVLTAAHHEALVVDIATINPEYSIAPFDAVILGSPTHSSKHSSELGRFIKRNRAALDEKKTAFFSVSLSAAEGANQCGDSIQCMDQFLTEVGWTPSATTIFAGGIPIQETNWLAGLTNWLAGLSTKMIVGCGGRARDSSTDHQYTNWASVDGFARDFITLRSEVASQYGENTTRSCHHP